MCSQGIWEKDLHPIASSRQTDTLGTVLEREDLSGVDPGNRCPGQTIDPDEDIRKSYDSFGGSTSDGPLEDFVSCVRVSWGDLQGHLVDTPSTLST